MNEFGKLLITFGIILLIAGIVVVLAGRANLPIGRLPGDIAYRGKNASFYFPIVTCIVLSILLSLVMWVVGKFGR